MLPFIASIGSFIPGLFGKELPYKTAKIAGFITFGVLLIAILGLGKCSYDRSVVNQYKTAQAVKVATETLEAERRANQAAVDREVADALTNQRLATAASEAARADPKGAAQTVGPVTRSYYETLRKEKKQ